MQLSGSFQLTPTLTMNSNQLTQYTQQIEYVQITKNRDNDKRGGKER